ncbi:hypothetical protein BDK92_5180 [Micromonospora pisi]|uniref:Uncharacterized protein n=1 Tax=Micromonospora pisi TaxID=589240 RepID=A0A495JRW2_9ACTN|nr:hypothetical protein [Micromonospora pisi]RKR90799.1 hypothetical protein BDK92_5180 [Micromonospora pisi]
MRAVGLVALATGAGSLGACGLFDDEQVPPPPDPLAVLVTNALDLAGRYDAAVVAFPELADRLGPVAQAHRAHAEELARVTRTTLPNGAATPGATGEPSAPATGDQKATLALLRAAETEGRQTMAKACLDAPPERAALLGSIAAARATHLEVLR